jgi:hypothetical protein
MKSDAVRVMQPSSTISAFLYWSPGERYTHVLVLVQKRWLVGKA